MAKRKCWRDGCSDTADKWGMCTAHYQRHVKLYRPERATKVTGTNEERFYFYLHKGAEGGCWIWGGALNDGGYGVFRLSGSDGAMTRVHRFAYELLVGPIPEGLELDHTCRIHPCANPAHLEPTTQKVNTLRGVSPMAENARKKKCPQGHLYDEANTYVGADGHRQCLTCRTEEGRRNGAARTRSYRERNGLVTGLGKGGYQTQRTHCPQNHEYTEANTIREGNRRRCRTCVNEKKRNWREGKKA